MENVKDVHAALKAVISGAKEIKQDSQCPYDIRLNLDKVVRHATRIDSNVDFLVNKHDICQDHNPFFLQIIDDIEKASEEFLEIHSQYKVPYATVPFFHIDLLNWKIGTVANSLQNFKVSLSLIDPISNHVSEVQLRKVTENVAKTLAPALGQAQTEALEGDIERELHRIRDLKTANKPKPAIKLDENDDGYECDRITPDEGAENQKVIEKGLKSLEATGLALAQVMAAAEKLIEPDDVYSELRRPLSEIAGQMRRIQKSLPSLAKLFECKTIPQPFFISTVEDIGIICAEFLALKVELEEKLSDTAYVMNDDYKLEQSLAASNLAIEVGEDSIAVAGVNLQLDATEEDLSSVTATPENNALSKITQDELLSPTTITINSVEDFENQLVKHPLDDICFKFEDIKSSLHTFDFNLEMAEPMIDFLSNAFVQQTTNEVIKNLSASMKKKRRPTIEAEERQLRRMLQLEGTDLPDEVVFGMKTSDSFKKVLAAESESRTYYAMGVAYYEGYIEKDYMRALHFLNGALDKGEKDAAFYLGEMYYNGLGVPKDYIKAFDHYKTSAFNGNGESLSRIGYCLSVGHGTELNTLEAIRHFKLAYEKNSPSGTYHYGHAVFYGQTMDPNPKEGHDILYKASLKRVMRAKLDLAVCYECGIEHNVNIEWAYTLVEDCYEVNVMGAWKMLARYKELGIGTQVDLEEAARICKKQSETEGVERPDAIAYYGMYLVTGRGVEKDARRGLRFIRSGCVLNRCDGYRLLGDCYWYGHGVERDVTKAVEYYEQAAEGLWGMESKIQSHLCLGDIYEIGDGVPVDVEKAARYYKYAADRYNAEAQNRLAAMYEDGTGVEKSVERAFHYYFLASRSGHPDAKIKFEELKNLGIGGSDGEIAIEDIGSGSSGERRLLRKIFRRRVRSDTRRRRKHLWNSGKILEKLGLGIRSGRSTESH